MQQERWLPFRPEECPEAVWDQLPEGERRKVIEIYARLMARAGRAGTTSTGTEEASREHSDS